MIQNDQVVRDTIEGKFENTTFINYKFRCDLMRTVFKNCTFDECDFVNNLLLNVRFINCKFVNNTRFNWVALRNVEFHDCKLYSVYFTDSNMRGSKFRGGETGDVFFTSNTMEDTTILGTKIDPYDISFIGNTIYGLRLNGPVIEVNNVHPFINVIYSVKYNMVWVTTKDGEYKVMKLDMLKSVYKDTYEYNKDSVEKLYNFLSSLSA